MGQKLVQMYEFVKQNGGLPAQMRVAMKTGLPSEKAAAAPDAPDMIAKFRGAVKEICGKEPPA
ncbi:MAG: hypothetical protein JXQ73_25780 [Phycisphaerae bacterium]|nr:hypothetical protein [Phycisphaerae bacterium]